MAAIRTRRSISYANRFIKRTRSNHFLAWLHGCAAFVLMVIEMVLSMAAIDPYSTRIEPLFLGLSLSGIVLATLFAWDGLRFSRLSGSSGARWLAILVLGGTFVGLIGMLGLVLSIGG